MTCTILLGTNVIVLRQIVSELLQTMDLLFFDKYPVHVCMYVWYVILCGYAAADMLENQKLTRHCHINLYPPIVGVFSFCERM